MNEFFYEKYSTSLWAIVLVVLTTANFGGFSNFCRYYTRSQAGKSTGPLWNPVLWIYDYTIFCAIFFIHLKPRVESFWGVLSWCLTPSILFNFRYKKNKNLWLIYLHILTGCNRSFFYFEMMSALFRSEFYTRMKRYWGENISIYRMRKLLFTILR
jgi:hypothetical protein